MWLWCVRMLSRDLTDVTLVSEDESCLSKQTKVVFWWNMYLDESCPVHYASIPIERGQLEFWARLIPLPPFWSSLIISDKIFGNCQLRSFTFEWYLGTSWTQSSSEAKINCSSSSLQTGCEWNVGTSWTLASKECIKYFGHEKNSQNICIFQIPFSQWWAPQTKKLFWDVFLSTH